MLQDKCVRQYKELIFNTVTYINEDNSQIIIMVPPPPMSIDR